jgi:phosphoglycolate phosphatase
MIKLVIFDIDGTIVDAYGAIAKSLNFTLKKLGYRKASLAAAKRAVGHGERDFIRIFVKEEDIDTALKLYRRNHQSSILTHSRTLPGAKRVLKCLKKRGYKMAIVSNRPHKYSDILLKHLGIKKYFDVVSCAKNKDEFKPKAKLFLKILRRLGVEKNETLYVGDMAIDVRAGRNAGIKTVAITGGSSSLTELKKERPYRIVRKLPEILKLLSK